MKKFVIVIAGGLLFCLVNVAHATIIVQYTFPGSSFSPTATAANTTATPVNDTGSSADLEPGSTLPNSIFLEQLILSTTPAAAVANNQFFQFTTTPTPGFELDLTSLTFDAGRGGGSTPRGFVLRSSLDGFASDIATGTIPTVQPTLTPFSIDLSGISFQGITSALTFRIYGFTPSAPLVGVFYDDLTLNGTVVSAQAVSEPGTLTMVGMGLLGLLGFSWRCRRTRAAQNAV